MWITWLKLPVQMPVPRGRQGNSRSSWEGKHQHRLVKAPPLFGDLFGSSDRRGAVVLRSLGPGGRALPVLASQPQALHSGKPGVWCLISVSFGVGHPSGWR